MGKSSLRVSRVMPLDALRQQTLAAALPSAGERGAPTFTLHACTKPVLAFTRTFGWLVRAFHETEKWFRRDSRAVTVGMSEALSIAYWSVIVGLSLADCQCLQFLK